MRSSALASHLSFAAFGLYWGTWGAALPALRDASGVGDAGLGTALLFVGLGALPAMLLTGRAVDRFGARIAGVLLLALAVAGVGLAVSARDLVSLSIGMLVVGAASGAADVAGNALAGLAEQRIGGRVITVSHAVFSSLVVAGSLGAGALRGAGVGLVGIFGATGALMAVAAVVVVLLGDRAHPPEATPQLRVAARLRLALPFVGVGLVGALAFAAENAHQSWSAIFLQDELHAGPALTAIAPATFATFAALTRFAAGLLTAIPSGVLLAGGAVVALGGSVLVAVAEHIPVALAGLALAAIGTSVLFPTLLSRATRDVPPARRGRATSALATTAYLGFLLGPVYVGVLADAAGLRSAMLGVAALAAVFTVVAPLATRRSPRAG